MVCKRKKPTTSKIDQMNHEGAQNELNAPLCPRLIRPWNGLTPGEVKPGPNALAHTSAVKAEAADFFLRPPTLTASNFEAL